MITAVLILYLVAITFILFYSFVQLSLVINYARSNRKNKRASEKSPDINTINSKDLPFVTIQLPIYNELYVVERLMDAVAQFHYPKDRFEIQVLDDSTDETVELSARKVASLQKEGFRIFHIHRKDRTGYKAGALAAGMTSAQGEFIAIFDADFVPEPDFLLKTIPYFDDEKTGAVQTKWGHINRYYSLLTRLQAFGLDVHFSVEQKGRNEGGFFINFNGTAGIWRKGCIEDAGGWSHDTITEDLDLSFRAQMKGWKFLFLENVVSPAELPVVMSALKNQQFRWNKGGAENFRKLGKRLLRNKEVPFKTKVHGIFHLSNTSIFICVFITAILSIPILYIKSGYKEYDYLFNLSTFYIISMIILSIFFWHSYKEKNKNFAIRMGRFGFNFVLFLCMVMGLSLHNSVAVIEGHLGKKSSFIRTPKFNIKSSGDNWKKNKYLEKHINIITIIEGLLSLYFMFGIISCFWLNDYGLLLFHVMLCWGFAYVFVLSIKAGR